MGEKKTKTQSKKVGRPRGEERELNPSDIKHTKTKTRSETNASVRRYKSEQALKAAGISLKENDKELDALYEEATLLEDLKGPLLWISLDPEIEWLREFYIEEPEVYVRAQILKDTDLAGIVMALRKLVFHPILKCERHDNESVDSESPVDIDGTPITSISIGKTLKVFQLILRNKRERGGLTYLSRIEAARCIGIWQNLHAPIDSNTGRPPLSRRRGRFYGPNINIEASSKGSTAPYPKLPYDWKGLEELITYYKELFFCDEPNRHDRSMNSTEGNMSNDGNRDKIVASSFLNDSIHSNQPSFITSGISSVFDIESMRMKYGIPLPNNFNNEGMHMLQ